MKKLLAILLVVLMAFTIVACDKKPEEPAKTDPVATEPAGDVYKVINLVNGNLGDKSFFDSAEAGLKKLADAGRITYETKEMGATDADQPKWQQTINDVAAEGKYDLIICGTYQMPDYLKEAATAYPDQKFLIYDDTTYVGDNSNVVNVSYRQNDMGYLIGVFAASMTSQTDVENMNPEKVLGFIGGIDSPVINDFLYGFLEGAKATDPEIKVDTRYVNSYADTATAKEMGLAMINDNKVDIIWGVAGLSGNGGAEAALETGKAWFVGVDSDQELTLSKELAAITLTSGLKNIGDSLMWIFDEWDAGRTYWGKEVNLGLPEGGVGIVTDKNFAKYAPQAVQDKVAEAEKGVRDGSIKVSSAIGDETDGVVKLRTELQP
ncbi:MAG: BMP family ABC transporter substrate-binding protein [Clostridiaceae bacterium]|jgi:basic membrane protein A|nr:BMP family ABC transporter substrate-binding protein [Clostridiaceae bacterium]